MCDDVAAPVMGPHGCIVAGPTSFDQPAVSYHITVSNGPLTLTPFSCASTQAHAEKQSSRIAIKRESQYTIMQAA